VATAKTTDKANAIELTIEVDAALVLCAGWLPDPLAAPPDEALGLSEEEVVPSLLVELPLDEVLLPLPVLLLLLPADVLGSSFPAGQDKLKRALVDRLSVMANLTSLAGLASRRVYQKTFFLPKMAQPTSCQYFPALSTVASAAPNSGPLYAQPVSVIQTSLPPETPSVASSAEARRLPALEIWLSRSDS